MKSQLSQATQITHSTWFFVSAKGSREGPYLIHCSLESDAACGQTPAPNNFVRQGNHKTTGHTSQQCLRQMTAR